MAVSVVVASVGAGVVVALAAVVAEILAAVARQAVGDMMFNKISTLVKHLWLDATDAERAISPDMLARLTQRVAASEGRHTGQIRIYVEAALPMSYLWRLNDGAGNTLSALIRQRAVMLFGKLRVWDLAANNDVLIYLLLAEQAIEIVADRGLSQHISDAGWQAMVARMSANFAQHRFEDGLTQAIGEVSSVLVEHFPAVPGSKPFNEQPDEPVLG